MDEQLPGTDVLIDLSQELASMGRGSMQRRILRLEAELKAAMERIRELEDEAYRRGIERDLAD